MQRAFIVAGEKEETMKIQIADVQIEVNQADAYTEYLSREYRSDSDRCDIEISVTEQEIEQVRRENTGAELPEEVLKSFAILEKLNMEMLKFDAFYLHAAIIAVNDEAYAFSAKSGTGKSTHIHLWKQYFGERAVIINGDKPFLRRIDGVLYACGSPWCGKEGWQTNVMVPLKALCFLERAEENKIERISQAEVIERIFRQIRFPHDAEKMRKFLELMDWLVSHIPCYRLRCNISEEAVKVSYHGMSELENRKTGE